MAGSDRCMICGGYYKLEPMKSSHEQKKSRTILVEFTVNWEDYEDVADELVIEDSGILESMKVGVSYRIIKDKNETNEQ